MELPIDHFRLLGVSSSAGAEEILRTFQLRLDRSPDKSFTSDALAQRAELLRLSADLLTETSLRQEYLSAISMGASALEISSNREVAGLILLWEANLSLEAFKLARKALQPPQTPALGSSREADLALIAALACRDAAIEQQDLRHYEFAAELLQEGIHLLQRMGKLGDQREALEEDLELLLPFRILDLLSRDLDEKSHQEGLNLLDAFISKRGGLEGRKKLQRIGGLKQVDFEIFFQQIRNFLTVQEQIDLFISWYRQGSADAGFLAAIALVASGFSLKKPADLQEARKFLKGLNYQGLDPMPLLGCIDLLLGDIDQAEARFKSSNDEGLKTWLENYPGEELAAFCHYCRNWLGNDVLHGYRDIDLLLPDLDTWFGDKNVQDYLEELENKGARGLARAGRSLFSSFSPEKPELDISNESSAQEGTLPMPGGIREIPYEQKQDPLTDEVYNVDNELPTLSNLIDSLRLKFPFSRFNKLTIKASENPVWTSAFVFLLLFVTGTSIGLISLRIKSTEEVFSDKISLEVDSDKSNSLIEKKDKIIDSEKLVSNAISEFSKEIDQVNQSKEGTFKPLSDESPSESQIKSLLERWLSQKAKILSGSESEDFAIFARKRLANRVFKERAKDKTLGEKQIIMASITSMEIQSRTNKRIAVKANLRYQDQRINSKGEIVSETVIPSLSVQYILGREKNIWQLVDYISGI